MGAWGELAFDNDTANDWAYGLDEVNDVSLVESALSDLEQVGTEYLDSDVACRRAASIDSPFGKHDGDQNHNSCSRAS